MQFFGFSIGFNVQGFGFRLPGSEVATVSGLGSFMLRALVLQRVAFESPG